MEIAGLGRKLRILADEVYDGSWNELANAFNRKYSTLYGWANMNNPDGFGIIPDDRVDILIAILADNLPHLSGKEEAEALMNGSVQAFEQAFSRKHRNFWNQIIQEEAILDSGRSVVKPELTLGGSELVQFERGNYLPNPKDKIWLSQWFRLEFNIHHRRGHVWALQNSELRWAALHAEFDPELSVSYIPGLHDDGSFAHLRENEQTDIHRFILLHTPAPPPLDFYRYLEDGIELDGIILGLLANFYSGQPKSQRKIHMLEIEISETDTINRAIEIATKLL
ncbi:MAG: hypothetical protein AAF478_11200 [Pseudomonadota bacterium]